jgi:ATP-dependent exoDNAse (exonuclease V) beta subunit
MSAAARVLPTDHVERALALDPSQSYIVQAPAGSGKTELLIQRYLTLLARVDQPESVLAITFTRKAAGEMRSRVLAALGRAADESEPTEANAGLTWRLARAVLEANERLGWDVRESPGRLRIETIDALCVRVVRRMPWLARFGSMPGLVEDARELYAEAARHTLELLASEEYGQAIEKLALHVDNNLDRASRLLETMLEKRDQWMRHVGSGAGGPDLRRSLESTLSAVVREGLERVAAVFPHQYADSAALLARFAARNLARENPGHPLTRCADLTALPGSSPEDLDSWLALTDLLLTGADEWRSKVDRRLGFPADQKQKKQEFSFLLLELSRCDGLLEQLAGVRQLPNPGYTDQQWAFLETLFELLPAAAAQLKITFQSRGVIDFVELAQAAQRAIGPPDHPTDLALAFGHRLDHILVDEMQDTSITQKNLLESLISGWEAGGSRTVFLVGDPMQSIYGFREAEVALFLEIRRAGLRDLRPQGLSLRVNFRSRSDIVDWVNRNLPSAFPQVENEATGAVPYSPLDSFRPASESEAVHIHPLLADDPESEAQLAIRLLEESRRDFPGGTTAILVRARTHLPAMVRELQRRGVRFRAVEIDLLAEQPVVRDLLALTRALLHPADRPSWLALLRAPWCGLTLAELLELAGSDPLAPIADLAASSTNPRLARFNAAIAAARARVRRTLLRTCVERAWIDLGGPSCLATEADFRDAQRFFSLLEELDEGGVIEQIELLERRVGNLFGEPDTAASGDLQLMTIHKAKGLEFDTVIVPGLGYAAGQEEERLLYWSEVATARGPELLFAPVESKEDEKDPTCRFLRRLDRDKTQLEVARLLYVACTRAKERLHLIGHTTVKQDDLGVRSLSKPRAGSLLECLWPSVEPDFQRALQNATDPAAVPVSKSDRPIRRLPLNWQPPSPPPDVPWTAERREEDVSEEAVKFEWVGDTLRHIGTVVHGFLDRIARDGVEAWDQQRVAERKAGMRTLLASQGVPPADLDGAVDRATRAIAGSLHDPRGRWILTRRNVASSEYEAAFDEDHLSRRVVIDRTFVDDDNVRWVIDYKISEHLGGDIEAFLDNELERYRAQLETYARMFAAIESRPIRCGLYFPLLRGWREWAPRQDGAGGHQPT